MRDIALALFVFGMIPFILMRPFVGLLVWSWLGYMNPYRLCYGFAVTFPWNMTVAVITLISLVFSKESKKIPVSSFSVLMFLFLVWTGITTFYAVDQVDAWDKYTQFVKTLIMMFVTLILVKDRKRMHWLVWMVVISIGFYGFKGGIFTILRGGNYHVYGPAKSFIADNNDLAQAFCMILPLIRYLQLQAEKKWLRVGLGGFMALTGIATLGTYSRGGLIALFVVGVALLLKSRRQIALAIVLLAVAVTAYQFMPAQWTARMDTLHHARETDSAETRIQSWEFAANVAIHRPLLGGGFDVYKSAAMWSQYGPRDAIPRAVHSIYFRVLGEQGFIGLFLYLAVLIVSWRNCSRVRKKTRDSPDDKWAFDLSSMLQVSLLAYFVAGAATTSSYFDLSWQLMAMCVLLKLIVETGNARSRSPAVVGPISRQAFSGARVGTIRH
jgi:probable O-glycosylation ligase (exosortase A-associated)